MDELEGLVLLLQGNGKVIFRASLVISQISARQVELSSTFIRDFLQESWCVWWRLVSPSGRRQGSFISRRSILVRLDSLCRLWFRFLRAGVSEYEIRASWAGPAINAQYKEFHLLFWYPCCLFLVIFASWMFRIFHLHDFSQTSTERWYVLRSRHLGILVSSNSLTWLTP